MPWTSVELDEALHELKYLAKLPHMGRQYGLPSSLNTQSYIRRPLIGYYVAHRCHPKVSCIYTILCQGSLEKLTEHSIKLL